MLCRPLIFEMGIYFIDGINRAASLVIMIIAHFVKKSENNHAIFTFYILHKPCLKHLDFLVAYGCSFF